MLARSARQLPIGSEYVYEPKWDGFRCLAFCAFDGVDLRSRNDRPFTRYFPEIEEALRHLDAAAVLDGELMITDVNGRTDFAALMNRLHPAASRAEHLAVTTPATFVVFDALALGERDLRPVPAAERRRALEGLLADRLRSDPVTLSPFTDDPAIARRWLAGSGAAVDGVIAKRGDEPYQPGRRALVKVKRERTADCVVAGFRLFGETLTV
ncbi:MAG: ATP-dependent ligase, partial [Acidimicrobiia bacterium]|nr:ATP-dependent ligase [Acidimicrobiia bacterium]